MKSPLVSVIVPVYNAEKYIKRCIKSILCQTYQNMEIIVIDDSSNDKSREICEKMADMDTRIRFISKRKEGAGYARNLGMDMAHGEYLMFIDADDYLMKDCLSRMIEVALKEQAGIVKCKWRRGKEEEYKTISEKKRYKSYNHIEAFRTREVNIAVHGKLYHRKVIGNIRYPKVTTHDDEFIVYKFIYAANKIIVLDEVYYYYYMSSDSIMRQKREKMPLDFIEAYKERIAYFEERNEKELVGISHKELSIRIMLAYLSYRKYKYSALSKKDIENLFKTHYILGKRNARGFKEKVSLYIFYRIVCIQNHED